MTLASHIYSYPWLFAGISGLPSCLIIVILISLISSGNATPGTIPAGIWYGSFVFLVVLVAIVGCLVAYCLSLLIELRYWALSEQWTHASLVIFTVTWSLVFGCLSLLAFTMGFGDSPQPTSLQEFINNLFIHIRIPCLAFSQATLMSLMISTGLTVILVALARGIAWVVSVIRLVR